MEFNIDSNHNINRKRRRISIDQEFSGLLNGLLTTSQTESNSSFSQESTTTDNTFNSSVNTNNNKHDKSHTNSYSNLINTDAFIKNPGRAIKSTFINDLMKVLEMKSPSTIAEANLIFLKIYGEQIETLSFILNPNMRKLYVKQADAGNGHPFYELISDISAIGHIGAYSGVNIVTSNVVNIIHPNTTIFINGVSASGKSTAIEHSNEKLNKLSRITISEHKEMFEKSNYNRFNQLETIEEDNEQQEEKYENNRETTPFIELNKVRSYEVNHVDLAYNRRSHTEVKIYIMYID